MNNRKKFNKNKKRAIFGRAEGQSELFHILKNQKVDELTDDHFKQIQRLTSTQRQALFTQMGTTSKRSLVRKNSPSDNVKLAQTKKLYFWLSPYIRRHLISLLTGTVMAGSFPLYAAINSTYDNFRPVSYYTATWPKCDRLTPSTDACLYTIQNSLTWQQASYYLQIPTETIAESNANLDCCTGSLKAGNQIVIWRFKLKFMEE